MEFDNREYIGRGLDILRDALIPYVQGKLKARYAGDWWTQAVEPVLNKREIPTTGNTLEDRFATLDVPKLRRIMLHVWDSVFKDDLGENGRNLISEISGVRNPWAHQQSFDFDGGYDALGQIATLLRLIKADDQQELIKQLQKELSRSQVKKEPIQRGAKARPGVPRLPHAAPKDFAGRTLELNQLQLELRGGQFGVVVYGSGGFGKTTLVTKLTEQIKRRYPDGQIYLDLKGAGIETALSVKEIAAYIIQTLEPQSSLPEDESALIASYQRLAFTKRVKDDKEEPREPRRVLLFLDNVADAEQVHDLVPSDKSSVMLLTSRQQFDLRGFYSLSLDALPHDEAARLLMAIARSVLNEPQADTIATLLGDYPLALVQAGRYLAEDIDADPDEYITQLQQLPLQRLGLIERSLRLSYDALKAEVQKVWHEIAIFSGSFDAQAVSTVCDLDLEIARKRVNSLSRRSLIKHDRKTKRYQMHDLQREFALHQMSAEQRAQAERRHAFYFLETAIAAAHKIYLGDEEAEKQAAELFDWDWDNYEAAWRWASEQASSDISAARLCYGYLDLGWSLITQRRPANEWIEWLEKSLADVQGTDATFTELRRSYHLAQAYDSADEQLQAIASYERAENLARNFSDPSVLPVILDSFGKFLAKGFGLWDITGAVLAHYDHDYRYTTKVVWDLDSIPDKITVYDYWALGEREKSREIDVDELRRRSTVFIRQGKRAVSYLAEAVHIYHQLGYELDELNTCIRLSEVYADLGELESAIETAQHALNLAKEVDPDRVGEIEWQILDGCYAGLGHHFLYIGEPHKALECYEKFLAVFSENYIELDVLAGMAQAYLALGDPQTASECVSNRGAFLSDVLREGWEVNDAMYWRFGLLCEQAGYFDYAIQEMQSCLEWEMEEERPEALEHKWHLALVYEKAGQFEQAIGQMVECVELEIDEELPEAGEHMAYLESLRLRSS